MPELFDLDTAFESLSREVAERTHPRDARDAIAASRKRRTALGASAAVALIAIGGAAFGLTGDSDTLSPAGETQLPSPAVLDAAAMTAATDGWVGAWRNVERGDEASIDQLDSDPECISDEGAAAPDPTEYGGRLLLGASGEASYAYYADFGSPMAADQARAEIRGAFGGCGAPIVTLAFGDGTVSYYQLPADSGAVSHAWLGMLDNRLAMLVVNGAVTEPSEDIVGEVASALLAGLQDEASFSLDPALDVQGEFESSSTSAPAPVSESASPQVFRHGIWARDFTVALDGWSDWSPRGETAMAHNLPCVTDDWSRSNLGTSSALGTTAHETWADFEKPDDAQLGVAEFLSRLSGCNSADWTIDSSTVQGVVVAWYPEGTVWITSQGSTIAVLQLPSPGEPPADVAQAVGKLVIDAI